MTGSENHDCSRGKEFEMISDTLDRFDKHIERQTAALEKIAEHSAIVSGHEKRLDSVEHDMNAEPGGLFSRIREIELWKARTEKEQEIDQENHSFWLNVKKNLAPYVIGLVFFTIYLMDKYNVILLLNKLWKEFKSTAG